MNDTDKTQQKDRKKMEIDFDPVQFPGIAKTAYITSNELCKQVSTIFKSVFADFEGCFFETGNGGEPTISLLFNHGIYGDTDIVACERAGGKTSGSSILDRTRNRDRQLNDGDRYVLTEDGKDIISTLLIPRLFNNGKIDWRRIVSEWVDNAPVSMYNSGPRVQYTKVSFIDLKRICALIFGRKINGDEIVYMVTVAAPLTPMGFQQQATYSINMNYMLNVTSVSSNELMRVYEKLGYGSIGMQIIRG